MASFNKIILMGNITKTPELRSIPGSNTTVARTGLAVNRKYKDKEEVLFIDIVAFGRSAEIMGEYLVKGSSILVDGRLSMNSWEQQDGSKRVKHEIIIDTFQMIGSKRDSDKDQNYTINTNQQSNYANNSSQDTSTNSNNNNMIDEDDLPF